MEDINKNTLEYVFMNIYKKEGLTAALEDLFDYRKKDYIVSVYEGVIRNFLKELKIFRYNSYNTYKLIGEICSIKNNIAIFANKNDNVIFAKENWSSILADMKTKLSDKIALLEDEIENIVMTAFPDKGETLQPTKKFLNNLFENKDISVDGIYNAIVDFVGEEKASVLDIGVIKSLVEKIYSYLGNSYLFQLSEADAKIVKDSIEQLVDLIDSNRDELSNASNTESSANDEQVERIKEYYNRLAEFDIEIVSLTQQIESIKVSKQEYIDSYNQGNPTK